MSGKVIKFDKNTKTITFGNKIFTEEKLKELKGEELAEISFFFAQKQGQGAAAVEAAPTSVEKSTVFLLRYPVSLIKAEHAGTTYSYSSFNPGDLTDAVLLDPRQWIGWVYILVNHFMTADGNPKHEAVNLTEKYFMVDVTPAAADGDVATVSLKGASNASPEQLKKLRETLETRYTRLFGVDAFGTNLAPSNKEKVRAVIRSFCAVARDVITSAESYLSMEELALTDESSAQTAYQNHIMYGLEDHIMNGEDQITILLRDHLKFRHKDSHRSTRLRSIDVPLVFVAEWRKTEKKRRENDRASSVTSSDSSSSSSDEEEESSRRHDKKRGQKSKRGHKPRSGGKRRSSSKKDDKKKKRK